MIGILILARLESSRLPGKQLLKILDKTIIEWLILRIKNQILEKNIKIVIATSTRNINKKFEFLKNKYNIDIDIDIFYGSDGNIPLRISQCAQYYKFDKIVCIGGDNPLTSIEGCNLVIKNLDNYEFVETIGLPIGMNVFGMTYKNIINSVNDTYSSKVDLEYCWETVFRCDKDQKNYKIILGNYNIVESNIRVTLDYNDDYIFFKTVIEYIGDNIINMNDNDIIKIIIQNNFTKINNNLSEIYWKNFNNGIHKTYDTNLNYDDFKNNS